MRVAVALLLALAVCACATPSAPTPPGSSAAAPPTIAGATTSSPTAGPSDVEGSLQGLMPSSVNGAAMTKRILSPADRVSPRIFLKVVARLGKKPPDGQVALAYNTDATIYAVHVDGATGDDIMEAFLAERLTADALSAPLPTVSIGGKEAIRLGASGGNFAYASGDAFFLVECLDEATAADVLTQLP